ncbi:MAG TPA: hypothetical protein VKE24_10270, partial [Candidatus Acidoferrales bacterium]|nr:hypothetical protein [Candidatus Acidoferrales bacterium]
TYSRLAAIEAALPVASKTTGRATVGLRQDLDAKPLGERASVVGNIPSGAIDRLKDSLADRFYVVLEGKGVVSPEKVRPKPVK